VFRLIGTAISALFLGGLLLALLITFNWDVAALFEWGWNTTWNIINAIASFFMGNELFQKAVSN